MLLSSILAAVEAPANTITTNNIYDLMIKQNEQMSGNIYNWALWFGIGGIIALAILVKLWFDTYYLAKNQKKLEALIKEKS